MWLGRGNCVAEVTQCYETFRYYFLLLSPGGLCAFRGTHLVEVMDHQPVSENGARDKTHSIYGVLHRGSVLLSFLRIFLFPFAFVILVK
jgi:hypothetical protein